MKRNKGFTLVELLVVIVILAIITLIAVPSILGVIDIARIGAAKSSALGYIDAIEKQMTLDLLSDNELLDGTYDITNLTISYKGQGPNAGSTIIEKGIVKKALLKVNDYYVCYSNNNATIDKNVSSLKECGDISNSLLVGTPILDKAKTLVYDESGVCKIDGSTYNYMGGCYIKGASSNNYVWYNGFMWRIMGINSDGTVRLITDENVTALSYGSENTALNYITNEGYIHDWLNEYFYSHLNNTKSIIKEGEYFCSETTNGVTLTEGRTSCLKENIIDAKIGIISLDEYLLSGASSSYLNTIQVIHTMTPYNVNNTWRINYDNSAGSYAKTTSMNGIRPIINVSSSTIFTSGTGTSSDFYILGEDKISNIIGTIGKVVTSGEYVNLEGHIYRVVRKTDNGIKLILDGYYDEQDGIRYLTNYGDSNIFSLESGIGNKLNTDVIEWLGLTNSNKIVETLYYQGVSSTYWSPYEVLLKEVDHIEAKVGLIQMGDILASQSSTILTQNYTKTNIEGGRNYWTMTKYGDSYVGRLYVHGNGSHLDISGESGVRPVITIRSDLEINGGNGTWKNPYGI